MKAVDGFMTISFFILLIVSVFLVTQFYLCDNKNCKAFRTAKSKAKPGSKEYAKILLEELCTDGLWPLPYFGAAILTPAIIWFIGCKVTPVTFGILFYVSFTVTYFIMSFFIHHYV